MNTSRRGSSGSTCVTPSSVGIISRREQFLALKNLVRLDGQWIKIALLQTIWTTKLASTIDYFFFSNQMKEHSSQVVCPINYMIIIQNIILLKHKHKKVTGCFWEYINFVSSNSLSLFYLTVWTPAFFGGKKQRTQHAIVDRFASNTAFMSSSRPPQSHLHLVQ
jgi:hypothetical protein